MKRWSVVGVGLLAGVVGFFGGVWYRDSIADEKEDKAFRSLLESSVTPDGKVKVPDRLPTRQFDDTDGLFR